MTPTQRQRYNSMHPKLQKLYDKLLIKCSKLKDEGRIDWEPLIVSAHRSREEQDDCFRRKTTKVKWPRSAHNIFPSLGVDIQGMRNGAMIQGQEAITICEYISTLMFSIASAEGIGIRWGGRFKQPDRPHYELSAEYDSIKGNEKRLIKAANGEIKI